MNEKIKKLKLFKNLHLQEFPGKSQWLTTIVKLMYYRPSFKGIFIRLLVTLYYYPIFTVFRSFKTVAYKKSMQRIIIYEFMALHNSEQFRKVNKHM